jgi:hypothetical protein
MTFCNRTPEPHPVSTPATTDDFRYRYAKTEMVVLADPRLTQNDKSVYSVLKAHRNHRSGTAWPSRRTVGQIAGCTERAVSLATARLLDAGYITKDARTGRSTIYSFPLTCPPADTFRGTPERTFTDNRQFERKKIEPPQQQPAHERPGGSVVVVVPEHIAKETFPLRVGGGEIAPAAPDATTRIEAVPAAPDATARIEPAPAAPDATARIEPAPAASDATPGTQAVSAAPVATPEPSNPATNPADPALSFPAIISLAMQVGIAKIFFGSGLTCADAQMLLDELAGAAQHTAIRNPLAYLRRILSLHMSGELIPEHAERIAAQRAAQARNAAARQRALAMRLDERPPDTPEPKKPRDHSARLAAMAAMRVKLLE